jgi:4-amino-4-deoxychorismate lyase
MRLGCNPALAGIKHLNRLEQVLARAERSDSHAEGLMCSTDGRVVEGTMSNLFAVVDGVLMTPDVSRCGVAGVVRGLILERAGGCHIGEIHASELKRASEVFLTNSLIGIWPVTAIEWAPGGDTAGRYAAGPITRQLQQRIADAVVSA